MRLLVVSEGKHELNLDGETSALVELLRRMLPDITSIERRRVSDPVVQQVAVRGKSAEYEKRILMWVRYAERMGFDGLALVVDEDGQRERRRGVESAQLREAFDLPRAIGLAIRSFDAWMLADEQALTQAAGCLIERQPDPEAIRHPKRICRSLLAAGESLTSVTDFYIAIARIIDLDRLSERCPRGFAAFRDAVVRLSRDS